MPCFSLDITSSLQPICNVLIVKPSYENKKNINQLPKYQGRALLDSGASRSCLINEVANKIELTPFSKGVITNTTGNHPANIYKISLVIPISKPTLENNKIVDKGNLTIVPSMEVIEISKNQNFDFIIGMDVISQGSLFITKGRYTFCL